MEKQYVKLGINGSGPWLEKHPNGQIVEIRQVVDPHGAWLVAVDAYTGQPLAVTGEGEPREKLKRLHELEETRAQLDELESKMPWIVAQTGLALLACSFIMCIPIALGTTFLTGLAAVVGVLGLGITLLGARLIRKAD